MGRFPSELVQPAAAPDFLQLPAEPGRGRAAAVAAAVASTAAAWEVGRRREVRLAGPALGLRWRGLLSLMLEADGEQGQPRVWPVPGQSEPCRASQLCDPRDVTRDGWRCGQMGSGWRGSAEGL